MHTTLKSDRSNRKPLNALTSLASYEAGLREVKIRIPSPLCSRAGGSARPGLCRDGGFNIDGEAVMDCLEMFKFCYAIGP